MRRARRGQGPIRPHNRKRAGSTARSRTTSRTPSAPRGKGLTVELANRQRLVRIDPAKIRAVLRRALRLEGVTRGHIEVAFVDDETIRRVHHQFLKVDKATDVITFPLHDAGESLAGLIVVSVETAVREAPRHRQTIEQELLLYAVHGLLHLCGYDDCTPQAARTMQRRQRELLSH